MASLRIDPQVFEKVAGLHVGILTARNIHNPPSSPEVTARLREVETEVRSRFADAEAVKNDPRIAAWQNVHRSFGSNPNKFPPSVLALMKQVVNGKNLKDIGTLVDLYNTLSLRHIIPAGGEDLDKCEGDIQLTVAQGGEPFVALRDGENDPAKPGEIIYRDNEGVMVRRLNWNETPRTCLTSETKNAILVFEAIPPVTREQLTAILGELEILVQEHCDGLTAAHILDAAHPSAAL